MRKFRKRAAAVLMAALMTFSSMPTTAWAEEGVITEETETVETEISLDETEENGGSSADTDQSLETVVHEEQPAATPDEGQPSEGESAENKEAAEDVIPESTVESTVQPEIAAPEESQGSVPGMGMEGPEIFDESFGGDVKDDNDTNKEAEDPDADQKTEDEEQETVYQVSYIVEPAEGADVDGPTG